MEYRHGTQDDSDPAHLLDVTTNDEIAEWIADLIALLDTDKAAMDDWSIRFVKSTRLTFTAKLESGYDIHPLTGKQLVNLKHLWTRIAHLTVRNVKSMHQVAGSKR